MGGFLILLTPRFLGGCFHIFTATFQFKKLEKQDFSDNEFFSATGDILEMQQGIFMN